MTASALKAGPGQSEQPHGTECPDGREGNPVAAAAGGSPAAWTEIERREGPPMPLFRPRTARVRHPRTGREFERLVLETSDWVNVVALTPSLRAVLVRQYRFGSGTVTLEVPGGVVDEGEDPESAARRELLEETGYRSDRWRLLARVRPNPAFLSNDCYHFLALDARRVARPRPDEGEDIAVELVSLAEVADMLRRGEIDHSLVVSALCRVIDVRSSEVAADIDLRRQPLGASSAAHAAEAGGEA